MSGTIEFETLSNAEKAYATRNHQIFTQHGSLELHLSPPPSKDPLPLAQPRLIKSLPRTFTAGKVFDLCRPFGPIHSATLQLSPAYPPGSGPPKFKGQALVTFYEEEDGQKMVEGLNFLEVEGQNIIVALWDARRAAKARRSDISSKSFNSYSNASSPVQHKEERTKSWASSKYPPALSATSPEFVSPAMSRNISGASQWSNNTGDTSFQGEEGGSPKLSSKARGDGLSIDPCKLSPSFDNRVISNRN
jgi:polyadenylate-binding protein